MVDLRLFQIRLEGARSLLREPDLSAADRDALEKLCAELQKVIDIETDKIHKTELDT
jgi:hypothetical protein